MQIYINLLTIFRTISYNVKDVIKNGGSMLKLVKKLTKKQIILILISVIFVTSQVWLDLKIPDYMNEITKLIPQKGTTIKDILKPGSTMVFCAFGSLLSSIIVGYFAAYIAASFAYNLRKDVFRTVGKFGMEEIKNFSTSSLITRTTNDITQVGTLISMGLQVIIKAPIMAIWAITKIAGKSYEWSIATTVAILVLIILILVIVLIALPKFKKIQWLTDNLNRITRENLTGIRVVRAYNAENYQMKRFEEANEELTSTHLYTSRIMAIMNPVMTMIMSGLSLSIYFIGAYLINEANMIDKINLFSDMVVFSAYAMQVVMAFMMLSMIFIIYPRASVSAKRINEVLETETSIKEGPKEKTEETGTIEFKNVSFKYPDAENYVLKDISFKAKKGQTIAFIGRTGSGKSTVINLIPRLYDATEGEVLVDNLNVKEYKEQSLNDKIGYISQKAIMFKGTIKENVAFGKKNNKKVSKEKVKKAIEIAQGKDFVEKLPNSYNYSLAESGTNISGGQKQRLSIARAIARDPEIYIFDDSFSALDYKTDFMLRKNLKKYTKDATVVIVAQRIGTIKDADQIFVIEDGELVGSGTHKELIKKCDIYKEIALSQLGKEEIENA